MIATFPKPRPRVPLPVPRPQGKRLPKGKPMTLVAAFRCSKGGVMLCADREENDGYTRREVDKIYRLNLTTGQVFLAGAGPSGIVTAAFADIHQDFAKAHAEGNNVWLPEQHKPLIESRLRLLHKQYKDNIKPGYLDLLIVIAPFAADRFPMVYRTELALIIPEPCYVAAGTGKTLSDYFADRLYECARIDKDSLKVLGAFILRETEKAAAGVGLGADIQFIHEGDKSVHHLFSGVVKEIQNLIPQVSESLWSDWTAKVRLPQHLAG